MAAIDIAHGMGFRIEDSSKRGGEHIAFRLVCNGKIIRHAERQILAFPRRRGAVIVGECPEQRADDRRKHCRPYAFIAHVRDDEKEFFSVFDRKHVVKIARDLSRWAEIRFDFPRGKLRQRLRQ